MRGEICPVFQPNFHKTDPVTNRVAVNLSPKESNDLNVLFRMVGGNYNLTLQEFKKHKRVEKLAHITDGMIAALSKEEVLSPVNPNR